MKILTFFTTFFLALLLSCPLLFGTAAIAAPAPEEIARVISFTPGAWAERDSGKVQLALKAPLYRKDVLVTDGGGKIQILFNDETTVAIAPSGRVELSEFVFDGLAEPSFSMKVGNGLSRIVTGSIVKKNPDGFTVRTPDTIIGIRGTDLSVRVAQGQTAVISNRITTNEIVVTNAATGRSSVIAVSGQIVESSAAGISSPRQATVSERKEATQAMRATPPSTKQQGTAQAADPGTKTNSDTGTVSNEGTTTVAAAPSTTGALSGGGMTSGGAVAGAGPTVGGSTNTARSAGDTVTERQGPSLSEVLIAQNTPKPPSGGANTAAPEKPAKPAKPATPAKPNPTPDPGPVDPTPDPDPVVPDPGPVVPDPDPVVPDPDPVVPDPDPVVPDPDPVVPDPDPVVPDPGPIIPDPDPGQGGGSDPFPPLPPGPVALNPGDIFGHFSGDLIQENAQFGLFGFDVQLGAGQVSNAFMTPTQGTLPTLLQQGPGAISAALGFEVRLMPATGKSAGLMLGAFDPITGELKKLDWSYEFKSASSQVLAGFEGSGGNMGRTRP